MSLNDFKISDNIPDVIKKQVKYFYVFNNNNNELKSNILLITSEDKVFGFGFNNNGVLGLGHNNVVKEVTEIPELREQNIREFHNGFDFVISINTDFNVLYAWGKNDVGQLGRTSKSIGFEIFKPGKSNVSLD